MIGLIQDLVRLILSPVCNFLFPSEGYVTYQNEVTRKYFGRMRFPVIVPLVNLRCLLSRFLCSTVRGGKSMSEFACVFVLELPIDVIDRKAKKHVDW